MHLGIQRCLYNRILGHRGSRFSALRTRRAPLAPRCGVQPATSVAAPRDVPAMASFQLPTVVPLHPFCKPGQPKLRGRLILADRWQIMDPALSQQFPDIRAVVRCVDQFENWKYPNQMWAPLVCDPRAPDEDYEFSLNNVVRVAWPFLDDGYDIAVHCHKTFHRAPLVAANIVSRLTGVPTQDRTTYNNKFIINVGPACLDTAGVSSCFENMDITNTTNIIIM